MHVFNGTLTSGQLKDNISYPTRNRHFPYRHHGNADGGVDVPATKMQTAHGQGGNAEPEWQRNQFRGRWMERIPCNGGASCQENEKESCEKLHQGTCPEMKTFQLRHQHHSARIDWSVRWYAASSSMRSVWLSGNASEVLAYYVFCWSFSSAFPFVMEMKH